MIRYTAGQEKRDFVLFGKRTATDDKGRVLYTTEEQAVGQFRAMLSHSTQREQEQWKQMGHPITHQIVLRGASGSQAGDMLRYGARKFYVQGVNDPSELGVYEIIYCEERTGV